MSQKTEGQIQLPAGCTMRPASMEDVEIAVELMNICATHLTGAPDITINALRAEWESPDFDLGLSTRVVFDGDGRLIGYIEVWDTAPIPVTPWVWGRVHPEFEGQGIGTALLTWAEERARKAIARVPQEAKVAMRCSTLSTHEPTHHLLQSRDMMLVRHYWRMVIDLDSSPITPVWPEGIQVVTYAETGDLMAVFRAIHDAFRDHWGFVEQPEEEQFKHFQHWVETDEEFDPTLWFLAMDGDEIAGASLCRPRSYDDPDMGWVSNLGVRRAWRRQGLALALLHHSFAVLQQHGRLRVGLGVDAASLTGATKLYEKAGMHVARQSDAYEKVLRAGHDLGRSDLDH